jgi:DNA polymerase III delta subunit
MSLYLVKNDKSPLGNRNFLIPKFRKQAQRYSNEQLEQVIIDIATTDSELRRSKVPPQTQVEMLALKLVESVKSRHG